MSLSALITTFFLALTQGTHIEFIQKILGNDTDTATDVFGDAIDIYDTTAVIGSPGANNSRGAAYLFTFDSVTNQWSQTIKLTSNDAAINDNFGASVSIYKNTIAVGSPHSYNNVFNLSQAGAVYIFEKDNTTGDWKQRHKILITDDSAFVEDKFGKTVKLYKDLAVIYASQESSIKQNIGKVYLFEKDCNTNHSSSNFSNYKNNSVDCFWKQSARLQHGDIANYDNFGLNTAITFIGDDDYDEDEDEDNNQDNYNNIQLLFSTFDDNLNFDNKTDYLYNIGAVYAFEYDNITNEWLEIQKIAANDSQTLDFFARSISASGNYLAVGADRVDTDDKSAVGACYIFEYDELASSSDIYNYNYTGGWVQTAKLFADESESRAADLFGDKVAIHDELLIVGAYLADIVDVGTDAGAAYVFHRDLVTNKWSQVEKLIAFDGGAAEEFGKFVAIYDKHAMVTSTTGVYAYYIQPPTFTPTNAPSIAPSVSPTNTPSQAPTNTLCDPGVQTEDTYAVCQFLLSFDRLDIISNDFAWESKDYCNFNQSNEFELTQLHIIGSILNCEVDENNGDDRYLITGIFLNNTDSVGELSVTVLDFLPDELDILDLSNNSMFGQIGDWSKFSGLKILRLNGNEFDGNVDFNALADTGSTLVGSNMIEINIADNNWDEQSLTSQWEAFVNMERLKILDLSNNQFTGVVSIDSSVFISLEYLNIANNSFSFMEGINDETMIELSQLKEIDMSNNQIAQELDTSMLPSNLTSLYCSNNVLFGDIDVNAIPQSLTIFECGNNDFGSVKWDFNSTRIQTDELGGVKSYELQYIDLSNSNLDGSISMNIFDTDGEFTNLKTIILKNNEILDISIDFEYFGGSPIDIFDIRSTTGTQGSYADFSHLTSFVIVKMDTSVFCVESFCSDSNTESSFRTSDTCIGVEDCMATCTCVAAYTESPLINIFFTILVIMISLFVLCGCVGICDTMSVFGQKVLCCHRYCKKRDDFHFLSLFGYIFQLWDFFSDILLCYDIYDHYIQESNENQSEYGSSKRIYFVFLIFSASFIFIPWFINLLFLLKVKKDLYYDFQTSLSVRNINISPNETTTLKNKTSHSHSSININTNHSALFQSKLKTSRWLSKYAAFLVLICMLSGGLTASLKLVNCNLFGLTWFDMGLPKYKQDESSRHRLWLNVLLENVPQIMIGTLYAILLLHQFDSTVLFALVSSVASVILAIFSIILEFPKEYYIYDMRIILSSSKYKERTKIRRKLRQTRLLAYVISNSLDKDSFCFVENVFYDGQLTVVLNMVCNNKVQIKFTHNECQSIMNGFLNKLDVECDSLKLKYVKHAKIDLACFCSVFCHCQWCVCTYCGCCGNTPNLDRHRTMRLSILSPNVKHIINGGNSGNSGNGGMSPIMSINNSMTQTQPQHIQLQATNSVNSSSINGYDIDTTHVMQVPMMRLNGSSSNGSISMYNNNNYNGKNNGKLHQMSLESISRSTSPNATRIMQNDSMNSNMSLQYTIGQNSLGQQRRSHNNGDGNGYEMQSQVQLHLWNENQVSEWIENILIKNNKTANRIEEFMDVWNRHDIDGKMMLRFRTDNEKLEKFKNMFEDNSFGIWTIIEDSLYTLPLGRKKTNETFL